MLSKKTDRIPELKLPKWPFILGDLLLIGIAFTIAILGGWNLTDWQVIACVLSVALGAVLFILPFIVEFQARGQEAANTPNQQLTSMARHLQDLDARCAVTANQIAQIEAEQSKETKTSNLSSFEASALQVLEDRLTEQAESVKRLQEQLEALNTSKESQGAQIKKLINEPVPTAPAMDPDAVTRIQALESQIKLIAAKVEKGSLAKAMQDAPIAQAVEAEPSPKDTIKTVEKEPAAKAQEESISKEKTEVSGATKKATESRLLKRAIEDKQDRSTQAVDRIIKAKKPLSEKALKPVTNEVQASSADESGASTTNKEVVPSLTRSKTIPELEPDSKSEPQPMKEVEPKSNASAVVDESFVEKEAVADTKLVSEAPKEGLFEAETSLSQPSKRRAKKSDTACHVNVLIGIGNKPYIRGSGGGLNWDTGVVMEFESIGKWRWMASEAISEPIEVQVYRNDSDPDASGKHRLEPGQKLEINSKF